jgi:nitroimidazol reductase NimA-like FMN-containing flavoprotein (pyridoxamine 5'-phosphate oxidase superfamily)
MTESRPGKVPVEYQAHHGLSPEAVRVLRTQSTIVVGTVNSDEFVHMTPVWYLFADAGSIYFESSAATRKVRNIRRGSPVSVLAKGPAADGNTLVVLGQGRGRVIDEVDRVRLMKRLLRAKYLSEEGIGAVSGYLDMLDDVVVEITPSTWVTWASSAINDTIRGLPGYRDGMWDKWFLDPDN